mgnify:CR=1 FL=1
MTAYVEYVVIFYIFYISKCLNVMTVQELIKIEEQLLCFETINKFDLNFNDYLSLTKTLKEIGEITHQYFILVKEYDIYLQTQNVNIDKRREMLVQYNEKILHTDINIQIPNFEIKQ